MKEVLRNAIKYDPEAVIKFLDLLYASLDVTGGMLFYELFNKIFNESGDSTIQERKPENEPKNGLR